MSARALLAPPLPGARLNFFDDPTPYNRVRVAGLLILATAVKFNNFEVEDTWKKQKSKESSGAVFTFGGTDPVGGESGFSVTFRCATSDESTAAEQFAQLVYDVWDALKPVPGLGGTAAKKAMTPGAATPTKAVGSPPASAESILADAQKALAAINNPTPAASSTAEESSSSTTPATAKDNPGPRPPTVPIELGWLSHLGVFAVARKKFAFSAIEDDKIEVTLTFVQDKPPTPAGAGAMAAPTSKSSTVATGGIVLTAAEQAAGNRMAAAAAAGASGT